MFAIHNGYNINFKGNAKVSLNKLSDSEETKLAAKNALQYLKDNAERMVPENGQFKRLAVIFEVKGSQNLCLLSIEHSPSDPSDLRDLKIGACRKGTDRFVSNFLKTGTKKEILEFLKKEDLSDLIYDSSENLSKNVDKQYN